MKLGVLKRISKDDLVKMGDVPKWIDALLTPLNDFIEKTGLALQNNLTFQDNFLGKQVYLNFTHDTELIINPFPATRGSLKVGGVIPISTGGVFIDSFKWVAKADGSIGVTIQMTGATTAKFKLQILLE